MRVMVSGAHGLIGTVLLRTLTGRGDEAVPIRRDGDRLVLDGLDRADAVVHLAGAGIGDARWTDDRKLVVVQSRVGPTTQLAEALAALDPDHRPGVLVSGSAVGFYGDRGDEELTEESSSGNGFLAGVCRRWEGATAAAEEAGVRVVHLRSGPVLAGGGGLLKPLLLPFKLGLGGSIGSGRQWFSWVAMEDEIGAILHAVDRPDVRGPLNATAPGPVSYREFAQTLGSVLHRPTVIPTPTFAAAFKLGRQGAREMVLGGQRVLPAKLLATGYSFVRPSLRDALEVALGGR